MVCAPQWELKHQGLSQLLGGLWGLSQESELSPVTVTSVVGFKAGKSSKATRRGQVGVECFVPCSVCCSKPRTAIQASPSWWSPLWCATGSQNFFLFQGSSAVVPFRVGRAPPECRAALPGVQRWDEHSPGGCRGLLGPLSHLQHPGGPICCG